MRFRARIVKDSKRARKRIFYLVVVLAVLSILTFTGRISHRESSYEGESTSYWVSNALKGNHSQRTLTALSTIGPEAAAPLLKALKHTDSKWKSRYLALYPKLPGLFQRFIPQPRSDAQIRNSAYMVLNRISDSMKGPKAKVLLPTLVTLLSDDDQRPSISFVDAKTHRAVPHGRYIRSVAADMLGAIGPDAEPAVPALIAALSDEKWKLDNYYLIPRALGMIGPSAKAAVPALQGLLKPEYSDIAAWVAEALWRIDPAQAMSANRVLEQALSHTNRFTRVKAVRVHWRINHQSSVALPVLLDLMNDPQNYWIVDTMRAIEDIGPLASQATPLVTERLSDKNEVVAKVAVEVLKKIDVPTEARSGAP